MSNMKQRKSYQEIPKEIEPIGNTRYSMDQLNSIVKIESIRPLTSNTNRSSLNALNSSTKKTNQYDLRYLPKRKVRAILSPKEIPLTSVPIKPTEHHDIIAKEIHEHQSKVNKTSNSENDFLMVRTDYMLKFAHNSEIFNRIKKYIEYVSKDKAKVLEILFDDIRKIYDISTGIYFDKMIIGSQFSYNLWKELMHTSYDYSSLMIKLVDIIFREFKWASDYIVKLKTKNFELETQNTARGKEIEMINDFIKKNDLNKKIDQKKQKNESIQEFKKTFLHKENAYILTIYRLEDEVKELTALLEQNKQIASKMQDSNAKAEYRKKAMDDMRIVYNQEIMDIHAKYRVCKDENDKLKQQIEDLEQKATDLYGDIQNEKDLAIDIRKINQTFKNTLNQRLETINMLYHESDMWKYLYEKEILDHQKTKEKLMKYESHS